MLLLAAVLVSLLSLHYHLQRKALLTATDADLQNSLMIALPALAPMENGPRGPRGPRDGLRDDLLNFEDPAAARPSPDTRVLNQEPAESADRFLAQIEKENIYLAAWDNTLKEEPSEHYGTIPENLDSLDYVNFLQDQQFISRNGYRELVVPHHSGQLIVLGRSLAGIEQKLERTRGYLTLIGCAVFLLGYAGGRFTIDKTLRPIGQISRTAEEITKGDHSRRIELSDAPAELAGLALSLNNSFDHLESAIQNQKRFSADASHELRTPIAVVMAQTQAALKRDRSTEEYKAVLEACMRASQRMKSMADSLLQLTRIDAKENALDLNKHVLNDIVSNAAADAAHISHMHYVNYMGPDMTIIANIDSERIDQVLTNLLSNAVKHNSSGCSIQVTLKKEGDSAHIEISDDGQGIDADALPHIFERFFRVDKARSRQQGGSGLGLSIVKSIVEAHGGTIEATSIPGKKTTFTILLPLC
jgi:heavy metal sensor kinase